MSTPSEDLLAEVRALVPDTVEGGVHARRYRGLLKIIDTLTEERNQATAAVRRVNELADAWEARGRHSIEFSKTVPPEIAESLSDSGADWVWSANMIRHVLEEPND